MSDRPRPHLDFVAWGLLLAGILITLCVVSHEPTATPANSYPPPEPANILGPAGAWLASELFDALGWVVYLLLTGWLVLVLLRFLRRGVLSWSCRLIGWLILVPCAAILADSLDPDFLGGPRTGGGGALGAWLSALLEDSFEPAGRVALVAGFVLLGLLLALDFAVARGLRWSWRAGRAATRAARGLVVFLARPEQTGIEDRGSRIEDRGSRRKGGSALLDPRIPIHHPGQPPAEDDPPAPALAPGATAVPALRIVRPGPALDDERFDDYELPPLALLEEPAPFPYEEHDKHLRAQAALLEKTFTDFGLNVRVVGINTGPVISQYEIALETGLRVNKVTSLGDDIALSLRVPSVRIVAPIPGKNTVGVEVPNEHRADVRLKEVVLAAGKKASRAHIPLFLGKDTEGRPLVYDLAEMPHLLIAGRTGTGKSVCLNAIILSILMTRRPDQVKLILIDPKRTELLEFGKLPHLMHPVVTDAKKSEAILSWAVDKMEERYDLLSRARVRNIAAYNDLGLSEIHRRVQPAEEDRQHIPERMPYIVIVVDEMGDLMMQMKREMESHIIRLAQKSRAAGIHLVVATQKPTVDVITGLIKSNLPARICFQVSSRSDSRVVLDEMGADKLLGKGDMLFLQPGTSTLVRAQGTYASDREISHVVQHLECDQPCYAQELMELRTSSGGSGGGSFLEGVRARDDVYEQAIDIVVREGRGSVSLLQRVLGIGYGRAARLIDFMAEDGIVGPYNGSNAREVLYSPEHWDQVKKSG
ncbi:MAG: DNA translocase FtsK [Gemmataceae bacterium]|nr:DNA translocase FtsK [Gemmataceae bacterium]